MTAADAIKLLSKLPPDTLLVSYEQDADLATPILNLGVIDEWIDMGKLLDDFHYRHPVRQSFDRYFRRGDIHDLGWLFRLGVPPEKIEVIKAVRL